MNLPQFLDYLASYPHTRQLALVLAEVVGARELPRSA
jgi:hypothetical protein